jgi:hypothetical protein
MNVTFTYLSKWLADNICALPEMKVALISATFTCNVCSIVNALRTTSVTIFLCGTNSFCSHPFCLCNVIDNVFFLFLEMEFNYDIVARL